MRQALLFAIDAVADCVEIRVGLGDDSEKISLAD